MKYTDPTSKSTYRFHSSLPYALLLILLFVVIPMHNTLQSQNTLSRDAFLDDAREILKTVPLFDGHNDTPWQYGNRADYDFALLDFADMSDLENPLHTDIKRMREGMVGAQWWSIYTSPSTPESESVAHAIKLIDFVHRMAEYYPETFEVAYTTYDVERIFKDGKIASLMGLEGGHAIANSPAILRMFYELGIRYMTLTHGRTLDWADSATDEPKHGGLTELGEQIVREMNRIGMLADLSHVTPDVMRQVASISEAPMFFSHSSARGLCDHPRNVPDDVLDLVGDSNGIVMVTFVETFISEERRQFYAERASYQRKVEYLHPGQPGKVSEFMSQWDEANEPPKSTLEQVADHIDYIRDRIGVDHIGIGSDYDGIPTLPTGLEDVSTLPHLFAELLARGYSDEDLRKIAGENMIRVMRDTEAVSASIQAAR